MKHSKHLFSVIALSSLIFSGCIATKEPDYKTVRYHWQTGDTAAATQVITKDATAQNIEKSSEPLLWELNAGSISSTHGNFAASENFLKAAEARIAAGTLKEGDDKTLLERATAALGKYEPTMQEAVMVSVLRFYNSMGAGAKSDGLAASVAEVMKTQDSMLALKERTLFEAKKDASEPLELGMGEHTVKFNPFQELQKNQKAVTRVYSDDEIDLDVSAGKIKATYVNPFAYWLSGIITAHTAHTIDDFKRAGDFLKTALEIAPDNALLKDTASKLLQAANTQDVAKANAKAFGSASPRMTYVIYEGGRAPKIGSKAVEIEIPKAVNIAVAGVITGAGALLAKTEGGAVVGAEYCATAAAMIPTKATAYLPISTSRGPVPELKVNNLQPTTLVDFDTLSENRLRVEALDNASKAVVNASFSVVGRGAAILGATTALVRALESGNPWTSQLAVESFKGAVVASAQPIELAKPDERAWDYLPRAISAVGLPTPQDGKIDLAGETVTVPTRGVNIVRVYKADKYWPATVQVFTLQHDGTVKAVSSQRLSAPARPETKAKTQK